MTASASASREAANGEDPCLRRLAVRVGTATSRPCGLDVHPRGYFRTVPPDETGRGPHGRGKRHARHPRDGPGRRGRGPPERHRGAVPRAPREEHRAARGAVRPLLEHSGPAPQGVGARDLPRPEGEGPCLRGRDGLPLLYDGPAVPPGSLRRGNVPSLRLPPGPRRPVRELRESPGSVRAEGPEVQDPRNDAHPEGDEALLLPAQRVRKAARKVGRERQGTLAAPRAHLHAELAPGGLEGPADHPRPGLGHRGPRPRLRDEADLRLVRGRDGIPDRDERMVPPPWHAGGMEGFLVRSEGSPLLLHREGQHRVSHNLLAGNPDGLRWQARLAVRCAGYAIPKHFGGANERRSRPRRVAI